MAGTVGNAGSILPGRTCGGRCVRLATGSITSHFNCGRVHAPIFRRARLFRENINSAASIIRGRVCAFSSGDNEDVALHPRNATNTTESFLRGKLSGRTLPRGICCLASYCHCRGPRTNELHRFRRFNVRYFNATSPLTSTRVVSITSAVFGRLKVGSLDLHVGSVNYPRYHTGCRTTLGRCFSTHGSRLYSAYGNELREGPVEVLSYGSPIYKRVTGSTPIVLSCLYSRYGRRFRDIGGCLGTVGVRCAVSPEVIHKLSCCAGAIFRFISGSVNTRNAIYNNNECSNLVRRLNNRDAPSLKFTVKVRELVLLVRTRNYRCPGRTRPSLFVTTLNGGTALGTIRLTGSVHRRNFAYLCSLGNEDLQTRVGCTSGLGTGCAVIVNSSRISGKLTIVGGVRANRRARLTLRAFIDKCCDAALTDRLSSLGVGNRRFSFSSLFNLGGPRWFTRTGG